MDSFQTFFEGVKNPLRKARLKRRKTRLDNLEVYNNRLAEVENDPKFKEYSKRFPDRASKHLENVKKNLKADLLKPSLTPDKYEKINIYGFDVYFDRDLAFMEKPADFNRVKKITRGTIATAVSSYLKGIVPIRKPKIVITDLTDQDEVAYRRGSTVPAYYHLGIIYLDEYKIHDVYTFVHEYAHYLADRVNTQTQPILKKAYTDMLDSYYKELNKKKINLKDKQTDSNFIAGKKLTERSQIAKKLGFPTQYAFNDFDELFAEIIANWKTLPHNPITYRFKQAVKSVIDRL